MDKTHKVPVIEQQYAAAAAGAHLMLAAKALGFGSNWKTGAPAYHPIVRNGLGFGDDVAIIGFFYIGTEPKPSPLQRASIRSEERRVGKEGVSPVKSRWGPRHK